LDGRDRKVFEKQHRSGSVNIPGDEWDARLLKEVDPSQRVLFDCVGRYVAICRVEGWRLRDKFAFKDVTLIIP
jgi:hypothetical protein